MKNPKMSLSTVKIYDTSYLTVMSKKKGKSLTRKCMIRQYKSELVKLVL